MDHSRPAQGQHVRTPGADASPVAPAAASPKVPHLDCIALHPLNGTGALRAYATVKFGSYLTVKGFRVVEEHGRAAWVGVPCETKVEEDPENRGQVRRRYYPLIEVPDAWRKAIEAVVLKAWAGYKLDGMLPGSAVIGGQR